MSENCFKEEYQKLIDSHDLTIKATVALRDNAAVPDKPKFEERINAALDERLRLMQKRDSFGY